METTPAPAESSARARPIALKKKGTIELTPIEEALCQLLRDTCQWIAKVQPQPDREESGGVWIEYGANWKCEARIAGGWVRDKLLGQDSHDLDISLSSLTGHIFALLLRQYMLSFQFGESTLANDPASPFYHKSDTSQQLVGHITKIAANPEQSKNLETATATVAGLSLDFVNLRKEVYEGNSRIPKMTFGTAKEDAERRDITINALFYNIHTGRIEDLTRRGLDDMRNGIIRTPLEPRQTFLEDPLRILRCVRFANRFRYQIDEQIFACLKGESGNEVRHALTNKVSRERFGSEVDKMMLGADPAGALLLIEQMGLFDIVFAPPPGEKIRQTMPKGTPGIVEIHRALALLDTLAGRIDTQAASFASLLTQAKVRRYLYYSVALLPLRWAEWEEKKGKWQWAGACVIARGLKSSGKFAREPLTCLWRAASILHRPTESQFHADQSDTYRGHFVPHLGTQPVSPRATRALVARHSDVHRLGLEIFLELSLLWAMVADLSTDATLWTTSAEDAMPAAAEAAEVLASAPAQSYSEFYGQLAAEGMLERLNEPVLLNGKEVLQTLELKPGPLMSIIVKHVEAWQLDRDLKGKPRQEIKEQCRSWLRAEWLGGGIVPLDKRTIERPPKEGKRKQ